MSLLETASLIVTPNGYKEGKLYSVIPSDGSGDMSVTRATTATRVNSQGLVELVPYNLVTYSNDFSSSWALFQSTTTSGQADPFGGNNAIKLKYNTSSAYHSITQGLSGITGNNAHSVYAKAGELQFIQIASAQSIYEYANFNLGTGVIGTYGSLASNVQIENVGNGWYRCSVVFTNGSNGIYCAIANSASMEWFGISAYSGANTTDGLFLYGAQVNAGSLLPYQPTITRLNIPRLDYSNGSCPSLLVEPQRTNVVTWSEAFNNSAWVKSNISVTANAAISPDGTQNADLLNITSASNYIDQNGTIVSGNTYTVSCYVKSAVGSNQSFRIYGNSNKASSVFTATQEWQRFTHTFTADSTSMSTGLVSPAIVQLYAYGFQLEAGSYPTSYIPTTSATVTRNADVVSKTGISSLIGQTEGTFVFKANVVQPIGLGVQSLLKASNDSESQLFIISYVANDGKVAFDFYIGSSYSFTLTSTSPISKGINNIGIVYKAGAYKLYINGSQVASSTNSSPITNTISKLSMGSGVAPMYYDFLNVWKTALTDDQLELLTGTSFNTYAEMASYYNYILQ